MNGKEMKRINTKMMNENESDSRDDEKVEPQIFFISVFVL